MPVQAFLQSNAKRCFYTRFLINHAAPEAAFFISIFKAAEPQKGVLSRMLETKLKPNNHPLARLLF